MGTDPMSVSRPVPHADDADVLRRMCHAFASTTDMDQAVEDTVGWVRAALGTASCTVGLVLPDAAGRLRVASTLGRKSPEGRLRSSRRRRAFETKRPVQVDLREPAGRALLILPLVCRGEAIGIVEIVARRPVIDERADLLDVVAGQAAAVLRNARERRESERALRGLGASVELASQLFLAGTPERAMRFAVDLCREHLGVPIVGWLSKGGERGAVVIRGMGSAKRGAIRHELGSIGGLPPAEMARRAAAVLEPVLGTEPVVVRAGDAVLASAGMVGDAGVLLLETVARLLGDALRTIAIVTEARARSDGLDLGIAWTAHELRGPLIGARAAIDHLLSEDALTSSDRLLRGTRDELEYLASLVDPLLRWAVGSGQLNKRRTDLVRTVREAIAVCDLEDGGHRIALFAPAELELRADPKQLRSAIANLVRNALAYSPDGSQVIVEVGRGEGVAWTCVRDRGPGIPPDEQDLIFDPLARGQAGTGSRRGAGLGLFIARRVVEAHGGTVRLLPSRRGAVFCLELPVAEGRVRSAS